MKLSETIDRAFTAILVLAAVVLCILAVRVQLRTALSRPVLERPTPVPGWRAVASRASRLGTDSAPIRLLVFSDYQCPACRTAQPALKALVHTYHSRLAVGYMHFPLTALHPLAHDAARAAECARLQGRFAEYHDLLFSSDSLRTGSWDSLAVVAGVPHRGTFGECMRSELTAARVEHDIALGKRIGVVGTPMYAVDGYFFGYLAPHQVVALVDSVMATDSVPALFTVPSGSAAGRFSSAPPRE